MQLKEDGENCYVHPSVDCSNSEMGAYAVIEKDAQIRGSASFCNSIILPEAVIRTGEHIENSIIGPEYRLQIENDIMLNNAREISSNNSILFNYFNKLSVNASISYIGSGGSDRLYSRVRDNNKSVILMECPGDDPDFQRHITYTEFFRNYSVPVPDLLHADQDNKSALFEDLGDTTLYSWLKCRNNPVRGEHVYRSVIDLLVNLHTQVTAHVHECPELQTRLFDFEHLRWETNYYIEQFVTGLRRIEIKERENIDEEFDRLAHLVDSLGKTVVHRDFQSQNIMITKGDVPRVVDYQGARMGPPAYDVASLLWDPYFKIEEDMRSRLIEYYIAKMKHSLDNTFDENDFEHTLLLSRLQRHMQALGAYSFLAMVKGKKHFLKFIPQALEYLLEETERTQVDYPVLSEHVKKIHEEIEN
jgi:aminoglycoside/choline kinase family phosphotransferase